MRTLSLTTGSSMAAKFSRGESRTCPKDGPPTYSTKLPSSSLSATKTSSSSSTDSVEEQDNKRLEMRPHDGDGADTWAKHRLTVEEGYELVPCALGAESKGNGRKTVYGV